MADCIKHGHGVTLNNNILNVAVLHVHVCIMVWHVLYDLKIEQVYMH